MASQGVAANSRLAQMQRLDNESESNQQLIHDQLVPLKLNESWAGRRLIEALSLLPPSNFGASLDMRFQQKQLEEREQRRIEMTGASAPSETTIPVKSVGNGRVRQMFDERRRGAGIDRSHPLKPIGSTGSRLSASSTTLNASSLRGSGPGPTARRQPPTQTAKRSVNVVRRAMPRSETFEQSVANGNVRDHDYDEIDNLDNETFPKGFSSLSLNEGKSSKIGDRNNNNSSSSNHIRLNPVVTKKSPSVVTPRVRQAATPPISARRTTPRVGAEKTASTVKTPTQRSSGGVKVPTTKLAVKPPPRIVPPAEGMASCKFCKRNFLEDRLPRHEQVCQKMAVTRRKIFDASKHRVKGTEAEKYLKKPTRTQASVKTPAASTPTATAAPGVKNTNWRKQHEEFIQSIRAAKQVKAYLAKGGKLSDLPPPPPSENPDYIQCPHCKRRFNQSAAERHIPKCATMLHNKPKPGAGAKRR